MWVFPTENVLRILLSEPPLLSVHLIRIRCGAKAKVAVALPSLELQFAPRAASKEMKLFARCLFNLTYVTSVGRL